MSSRVAFRGLVPWVLAGATATAKGPSSSSVKTLRFMPFFAGSVALGPTAPPKPGFAHGAIRGLPVPLNRFQVVVLFEHKRPGLLEQSDRTPMSEVSMNGSITSTDARDMSPLAARPHSKNDPGQDTPTIDLLRTGRYASRRQR
jgi:hypothetical protein